MKKFRKTLNELFICEECGKTIKNIGSLSKHISCHHNLKNYYDKWLYKENDNCCKICKNETTFNGIYGYASCCSKTCSLKNRQLTLEKNNLEKYGVKNTFRRKDIIQKIENINLEKYGVKDSSKSKHVKDKIKQTKLAKYGNENYNNMDKNKQTKFNNHGNSGYNNMDKIKQTKLAKYGNENYNNVDKINQSKLSKLKNDNQYNNKIIEKIKNTKLKRYNNINYNNVEKISNTCLKNHGVKNIFQSEKIKQQIKEKNIKNYGVEYSSQTIMHKEACKKTCLKKYGVEHSSQNEEIFYKIQHNSFKIRKFKDTDLWYQGSYELDFLEKYYDKHKDIQRGPTIKYIYNNKNKVYFPDFFIPSLNLIIEIKSEWIMKKQGIEKIKAKEIAIINNNYKYIIIIDKNYTVFNDLLPDI